MFVPSHWSINWNSLGRSSGFLRNAHYPTNPTASSQTTALIPPRDEWRSLLRTLLLLYIRSNCSCRIILPISSNKSRTKLLNPPFDLFKLKSNLWNFYTSKPEIIGQGKNSKWNDLSFYRKYCILAYNNWPLFYFSFLHFSILLVTSSDKPE